MEQTPSGQEKAYDFSKSGHSPLPLLMLETSLSSPELQNEHTQNSCPYGCEQVGQTPGKNNPGAAKTLGQHANTEQYSMSSLKPESGDGCYKATTNQYISTRHHHFPPNIQTHLLHVLLTERDTEGSCHPCHEIIRNKKATRHILL